MLALNFLSKACRPWLTGVFLTTACLTNAAYANLSVSPASHDFAQQQVGNSSAPQRFSFTNTNANSLELLQAVATPTTTFDALGNASTTEAEFIINNDACSKQQLSSKASCGLDMLFKPQSTGKKRAEVALGFLDVTGNLGTVSFVVEGEGVAYATLSKLVAAPEAVKFGSIPQNAVKFASIKVTNEGNADALISSVSLSDDKVFKIFLDSCSGVTLKPKGKCSIWTRAVLNSAGDFTATLNVVSNASNNPLAIPVSASAEPWCGGNVVQQFSSYPNPLDFGTEQMGGSYAQWFTVFSWTKACDALKIKEVSLAGANADEFKIGDLWCYNSTWQNESYSSCYGTVVFNPSSAGSKAANLQVTFDQAVDAKQVPVQAKAVESGNPALSVVPDSLDFGEVKLGFVGGGEKVVTVSNTGDVNLHLPPGAFSLSGAQASAFSFQAWNCLYQALKPGQSCQVYHQFNPTVVGAQQAKLLVAAANNQTAVEVNLKGTAVKPSNCNGVTIQSGGTHSKWDNADTWLNPDGTAAGRIPSSSDVVSIRSNSVVVLLSSPLTEVKALCVEQGGKLTGRIYVQASDFIQNDGEVIGFGGISDTPFCNGQAKAAGCAQDGESVRLTCGAQVQSYGKAGDTWWYSYQSGCPIVNTGSVLAGSGGSGNRYAGDGGDAILLARGLNNSGIVKAGRGGNLIGFLNGKAGRGGSTQLWGKLGGSGHLYNQHGARAIAGDGGNANPSTTVLQNGGDGGNLWLVSLPNVHLSGGIMQAGAGGLGASGGSSGTLGFVRIEPNVIDLSGATTRIEGGDVTIYGGNDWNLNLSGTNQELFNVTGDLTISVGSGGSIDLSGAADGIFKAGGKVQIFADNVVLDAGRNLEDVIQASGGVVLAPAKVLNEAALNGSQTVSGEPGATVTVNLVLANNGASDDSYLLDLTSTAAWTLGQFPSEVSVSALDSVELSLQVTLPSERGVSNTLSFSAISQSDSSVALQRQVVVSVNADSSQAGLNNCPTEGAVSATCNNRGRTLRNAQVQSGVTVEGGDLAGNISNNGTLSSGITVQPNTAIDGGVLTGNVNNLGVLRNLTLRDGSINGGQLGGNINAEGNSLLSDIALLASTVLSGGQLSGNISSLGLSPETLALLQNLGIQNGSQLQNLIIGNNVTLPNGVTLGKGVMFNALANIPRLRELLGLLPELSGKLPQFAVLGNPKLIDLNKDLVTDGSSILQRINALPLFKDGDISMTQDANTGALLLILPPYAVAVHPTSLEMQDGKQDGVAVEGRWGFRLNLAGGLSLLTQPALQDPAGFQQALQAFALSFGMTEQGDLIVSVPGFAKVWIMARPDWLGTEVPADTPDGLAAIASPHVPQAIVVKQIYHNANGQAVEQFIYPSPANTDALYANATNVNIEPFGLLSFTLNGQTYQGVLEYLIIDEGAGDGKLSVANAGDLNGDGNNDWRITYPQGETQVLYAKP